MSDLRVAIVGAGLSGLVAAIELKKHLGLGAKNVTIYEKAVAAGGTWQANTYPGKLITHADRHDNWS
jgi:cation diffusion facilitator CzcD-associated flavoprotein CzcO